VNAASAPGEEDDFSRFGLIEMEIVGSSPLLDVTQFIFGRDNQIRIICVLEQVTALSDGMQITTVDDKGTAVSRLLLTARERSGYMGCRDQKHPQF